MPLGNGRQRYREDWNMKRGAKEWKCIKLAIPPVQLIAINEEAKLIPPQQRVDAEAKAWAKIYMSHEEEEAPCIEEQTFKAMMSKKLPFL